MTSRSKAIPIHKTAWVTNSRMVGYYELCVDYQDQDSAHFKAMHGKQFFIHQHAQNAANAIREFVRIQRQQRREAAKKAKAHA